MSEDIFGVLGQQVAVHPAIKSKCIGPDAEEECKFMRWSIKCDPPTPQMQALFDAGKMGRFPKNVGNYAYVHMTDCVLEIDHAKVDKLREFGTKAPIILVTGKLMHYSNEAPVNPSGNGWESLTYNPHKHPEYVANPEGQPTDWWHDDEKYPGWGMTKYGSREAPPLRQQHVKDAAAEPMQPTAVTMKGSNPKYPDKSIGYASEVILHQHNFTPHEYMWARGLRMANEMDESARNFLNLFN